jgi:hypothetical protein
MVSRYKLGGVLQAMGKYGEAIVEYRAGMVVLDTLIERKQNVESAGKEKAYGEAKIAECERLMKE